MSKLLLSLDIKIHLLILLVMLVWFLSFFFSFPLYHTIEDGVFSVWNRIFLARQNKCHILSTLPRLPTFPYHCVCVHYGFFPLHHSTRTEAVSTPSRLNLLETLMNSPPPPQYFTLLICVKSFSALPVLCVEKSPHHCTMILVLILTVW